MRALFSACFGFFVLCASVSALAESVSDYEAGIDVEFDKFKQETKYTGSSIRVMRPGNYYWHEILLRATKAGGRLKWIQIYVDTHYTSSRYIRYSRGYDDGGRVLGFSGIDRNVESCRGGGECLYNEVFGLNVTEADLVRYSKKKEVEFKVEGNGDYMTFRIDGDYVKAFLNSLKKKAE